MAKHFIQDENFERIHFGEKPLEIAEYENCTFTSCDFTGSDLSGIRFVECDFQNCNMSLVKCDKTALRNVRFVDCKMLGWRFDLCHEFGLSFRFEGCQLNHSSFYQLDIRNTKFIRTQLREVDFTNCNLSGALFDECDLSNATFDHTQLVKADLRTAIHYNIDPELNSIQQAKFSLAGVPGLLNKYRIEIE